MANKPALLLVLFLAGWRTEDLLLQLLSSDSGLDDTIQVLFNGIFLLDGGNKPFSLLSACLVRLQALLTPPVLSYSRKVFPLAFTDVFV